MKSHEQMRGQDRSPVRTLFMAFFRIQSFCTVQPPLSPFRRSLCNCTLPKRGLFVEFGVKCIEITAVKLFLHEPEAFTESLVVDNLPLPQEADRITDLRIFYEPEDIIVGRAGLLFSGKVLVEIRDRIAF